MNKHSLLNFLYPFGIFLLVLLLAFVNHIPGTWLLGWDSLSDEFDFRINFFRQFTGVWNEYQGLGTAGGHAHSADIPRFIYLYLASFLLPTHLLRYSYFFLTLYVGAIGMFYFIRYLFSKYEYKSLIAIAATSFYIFNLGTLQIFFVPFEMFNAQFMVLPWIFMYVIKYVREGRIADYALLALFIFLGTPQAYAPTLFYVMLGSVALFLLTFIIIHPDKVRTFIRSINIGISFIALNLYWILPNLYYVKNYSQSVSAAKINSLFSEEAFLYSSKWGTVYDFPILRGFLFGWLSYKHELEQTDFLMGFWRGYMADPINFSIGIGLFVIAVIGLIYAVASRNKILICFIPLILIWVFMVIGANGFLTPLWTFLREKIELFREGLRFPYSKFSVLLQFGYSLFFAAALAGVIRISSKYNLIIKKYLLIPLLVFALIPVIYMRPFFNGNLIAKEVQIELKPEYVELFEYFKSVNPEARVAYLPANNLFGWQYYDWGDGTGYQGAGFIWFGLQQPFLTRDFDRWHPANEEFYLDLQYAIYNQDATLFEQVLNKYHVSYLIVDENLISIDSEKSLYFSESEALFREIDDLKIVAEIGKLDVYEFTPVAMYSSSVSLADAINSENLIEYVPSNHEIIASPLSLANLPYRDYKEHPTISLEELISDSEVSIFPGSYDEYSIAIPSVIQDEYIPVRLSNNEGIVVQTLYPEIIDAAGRKLFENQVYITGIDINNNTSVLIDGVSYNASALPKTTLISKDAEVITYSAESTNIYNFGDDMLSIQPGDCSTNGGKVGKFFDKYPNSMIIEAEEGVISCANFEETFSNTAPSIYKISFEYENSPTSVPMYCLKSRVRDECLNLQYERRPGTSVGVLSYYSDYVYVDDISEVTLSLVVGTDDSSVPSRATFKDVILEKYDVLELKPIFGDTDQSNKFLSITKEYFPLKLVAPNYDELSLNFYAGHNGFLSKIRNCDYNSSGLVDRVLNDGGFFEYSSFDALGCDTLEPRNMATNSSYLINFDSEAVSGKGLDICVWARGLEKCVLQERLHGGKESYLLPGYSTAGSYVININNHSIGSTPTINKLRSVRADYLPYRWLESIEVYPISAHDIVTAKSLPTSRKNTYHYMIDIGQGDHVVILYQSFDSGWLMVDSGDCIFAYTAPFFCDVGSIEHIKINGWANGWIGNFNGNNYLLVFWPQYMQFIGYGIALIFGLIIGFLAVFKAITFRAAPVYRS